ncbi:YtxH domain-containing protein [Paenibacillus aquistagni]|uniref:YtxH domain-containing protein n=1 Tax=Paenibacillus aquistagni TaxID=1852522 RepID=UPI00145A672A|nr:YtxH domain-containing protein [Paenibacillus aquistagni]NMM55305.1 YtxH domain-containing protein [Paenibacillus aquistagni]
MASKNQQSFLIGALVGTIAGGITALLLAPKAGRELRHDIAAGTKQASEKAQEVVKQVSERTAGLVETAKEKTSEWRQRLQSLREGREEELAQVSSLQLVDVQEDEDTVLEGIEVAEVIEAAERGEGSCEDASDDHDSSFQI